MPLSRSRRRRPALAPAAALALYGPALALCWPALALCWPAQSSAEEPENTDEETIVVEDRPDPRRDPVTVTVVPIDARLGMSADVGQALQRVAGVRVQQFGALGDFSAVSVRGSSLRQVTVALDGVPLNPDGAQVINLSELPLQAFSRLEVYRGAAPPELGVAPIGGVINLVTADEPAGAQLSALGGSLKTGRAFGSTAVSGRLAGQPADLLAFGQLFSTEGDFWAFSDNATTYNLLDDARLRRQNNDKRQLGAHLRGRVGGQRLRLSLQDNLLLRDEGVPGPIISQSEGTRLATRRNLAVLAAEGRAAPLRWTARLWRQDRREVFDDRDDEVGLDAGWAQSGFATTGLLAHARWAPDPRLVPAVTASLRRDQLQSVNLLNDQAAPDRARTAATGALSIDLSDGRGWASARTVLQLDHLDSVAGGGDAAQTVLSPRLGLVARPWGPLRLAANAQRAFRAPDLTELFGDRGALIGNPALRPERGVQWDVGGRLHSGARPWGGAELELLHFWSAMTDQIIVVQNSQNTAVPINFGETWTQGLELALGLSLGPWLESRSAATWTASRNLSPRAELANNQLPRVPARQLFQETSAQLGERLTLRHTWSAIDGNYWDATNTFLSAPRRLHGAALSVAPAPAWRVELSGQNLTDQIVAVVPRNSLDPDDKAERVEAVVDFAGYPIAGRALFLGLSYAPAPR